MTDEPSRDGRDALVAAPFQGSDLGRRVLPFATVAVLALASLALPPGPKSTTEAVLSAALFAGTVAAFWLPWRRLPSWLTVFVPLAYTASVLVLILALGGTSSGVGIVILTPLVWTSIYHRRWESGIVLVGIVVVEVITSLTPVAAPAAVILRRVVFWGVLGTLVSITVHDLRDRVSRTLEARENLHRRTAALESAAEQLTVSLRPLDVLTTATRLAAEIVASPGTTGRRAEYLRVDGDVATVAAEHDGLGQHSADTFPIADRPGLFEALRSRRPVQVALDAAHAGAAVTDPVEGHPLTHVVYVPIVCDGEIDGVLSVPVSVGKDSREVLEQCGALGHLVELALSNALSHETLIQQATTDLLTGLPNRRQFEELLTNRPGRLPFAILAIDLDGLKRVNDARGHSAGDELLAHVAATLKLTMRRGDMLARLGGDEFAAFLFDAQQSDGRQVAQRMIQSLAMSPLNGERPKVSIGVAAGSPDEVAQAVYDSADAAMYRAKHRGGGTFEVEDELGTPADHR